MSRDIKLHDAVRAESRSPSGLRLEASRLTAEAIQMFKGEAPTAVAYCDLDAWLEGNDSEVRFWSQVLNQLKT